MRIAFGGTMFNLFAMAAAGTFLRTRTRLPPNAVFEGVSGGVITALALVLDIDPIAFVRRIDRSIGIKHSIRIKVPVEDAVEAIVDNLPADAAARSSGRLVVHAFSLSSRRNVTFTKFASLKELAGAVVGAMSIPGITTSGMVKVRGQSLIDAGFHPAGYHRLIAHADLIFSLSPKAVGMARSVVIPPKPNLLSPPKLRQVLEQVQYTIGVLESRLGHLRGLFARRA